MIRIENIIVGIHPIDNEPIHNFGFSKKENFSRLFSAVKIPCNISFLIIKSTFPTCVISISFVTSSIFTFYHACTIVVNRSLSLKDKVTFLSFTIRDYFKNIFNIIYSDVLVIALDIFFLSLESFGCLLPNLGKNFRIIKFYRQSIMHDYRMVYSLKFEIVMEKVNEVLKLAGYENTCELSSSLKKNLLLKLHIDKQENKDDQIMSNLNFDLKEKLKNLEFLTRLYSLNQQKIKLIQLIVLYYLVNFNYKTCAENLSSQVRNHHLDSAYLFLTELNTYFSRLPYNAPAAFINNNEMD